MLPTFTTRRSFRPFFMPGIFDDDFFTAQPSNSYKLPAVNVREDEKNYVLELAVPGADKKELKIDMNEDVLTISSEVSNEAEESKNGYKRKEFNYSAFSRSFYVPEDVNREMIGANYKDGVLSVTLPKQEEEKSKISKKIEIS